MEPVEKPSLEGFQEKSDEWKVPDFISGKTERTYQSTRSESDLPVLELVRRKWIDLPQRGTSFKTVTTFSGDDIVRNPLRLKVLWKGDVLHLVFEGAISPRNTFFNWYETSMTSAEGRTHFFKLLSKAVCKNDDYMSVAREIDYVVKYLQEIEKQKTLAVSSLKKRPCMMNLDEFFRRIIDATLYIESKKTESQGILFRTNSIMISLLNLEFGPQLQGLIVRSTKRVRLRSMMLTQRRRIGLKISDLTEAEEDQIPKAFRKSLEQLLEDTFKSVKGTPIRFRSLLWHLYQGTEHAFDSVTAREQVIGIFFLRYLNPALVSMKNFEKIENDEHKMRLRESLVGVGRLLQWTAIGCDSEDSKIPSLVKPLFAGGDYELRQDRVSQIISILTTGPVDDLDS